MVRVRQLHPHLMGARSGPTPQAPTAEQVIEPLPIKYVKVLKHIVKPETAWLVYFNA